jgi:hypothetical protein
MATVVLRVRLSGGDHMDVTFQGPDSATDEQIIDHIVSTLGKAEGVLRTQHGDRLVLIFGRGVAAIEVAPRGAVI